MVDPFYVSQTDMQVDKGNFLKEYLVEWILHYYRYTLPKALIQQKTRIFNNLSSEKVFKQLD
jgi:hypothetical protein